MNTADAQVQLLSPSHGQRPRKALLTSLPMLLLTALMTGGQAAGVSDPRKWICIGTSYCFVNVIFFLMMYTGKTSTYRAVFLVAVAVTFVISFLTNLIEQRGSMVLIHENMIDGNTPFCHMVIPSTILPAVITRTIIFPGSLLNGFAAIGGMLTLWTGASLALGRGWCSWACFFGGFDQGFSRLLRKPVIQHIDRKWTYLSFAVLLAVVLTSAATLSPTYCVWLCPFKTVTEFPKVESFLTAVQAVIFVSLFSVLVVALPVLTRRRVQCGLFCPMGAFQSLTNPINVFDVRIDRQRCIDCGRCIRGCPTFSLDEMSVRAGRARITCTKCGECVDACPKGAAGFHVRGTPPGNRPGLARLLFLYAAFLFGSTFGLGMMAQALERIIKLAATGSML